MLFKVCCSIARRMENYDGERFRDSASQIALQNDDSLYSLLATKNESLSHLSSIAPLFFFLHRMFRNILQIFVI
jgi:hypothetical protein